MRSALWCQDASHVGRLLDSSGVQAEVVREACCAATVGLGVGRAACGSDVVAVLQRTATERGGLPLVWGSDNGSAYTSGEVAGWLAAERVVHLRSRVHTPTDNARAERAIGELKAESGLGKGVVLDSVGQAAAVLSAARDRLDGLHRRPGLGGRTARQADEMMPWWYAVVDRETFYASACAAIAVAVQGCTTARARRAAEREAIWRTLERYKLVKRTRGGKPLPAPDAERVS